MAHRFTITKRFKEMEVAPPTPADFTTEPAGEISVAELLGAGWSPYCFADGEVTFVRLDADLAAAAFVYLTQFRDALELARVEVSELIAATRDIPMPKLALIFSIGRCGTTLANHVLNGSEEIWCLSEPDVLDDVAQWDGAERADAMCALAKILFAIRQKRTAHTLGVKLRSQSVFCAMAFKEAYPDAHNIFMYRDAIGWANSLYAFVGKFGFSGPYHSMVRDELWTHMFRQSTAELMKNPDMIGDEIDPGRLFAYGWLRQLECFATAQDAGMDFYPIRYNEFNGDRLDGTRTLMRACGLSDGAAQSALSAFESDSQAGTFMGQGDAPLRLSDAQKDGARDVLSKHPMFSDADHILS